jgi:hypothetical protein
MATPGRSFIDTYNNQVTEMKRNFMSYVKLMRGPIIGLGPTTQCTQKPVQLAMTKNGFPTLPMAWDVSKYNKKELEQWFTLYLGQHYSMFSYSSSNSHHLKV